MMRRYSSSADSGADSGAVLSISDPCRQLFRMLPDRVCLLSPGGMVLLCNPAFAESFNLSREALAGKPYAALLPEAIARPRIQMLTEVLLTGETREYTDHLNGVWLEHRFYPLLDEVGGIEKVALISRDISEFILAKESTDARGERLNFLLDHLPGMIYRCSNEPGWPMVYASGGSYELTGYPASDFSMRNPFLFAECIHPEDRNLVWETVQNGIRSGGVFSLEYRIRDANQTEKWVWERGKLIQGDSPDICWLEGMILDITDHKNLEWLREEHERELVRARKAESLARMAGGIAHHFNNKLQAVIGNLQLGQLVARDRSAEAPELHEFLCAAFEAAQQAAGIGLNLLTCLGQKHVQCSNIDLADFLPAFCRDHAGKFRTELKIPPGPLVIHAAPEDISEIFSQLLTNANEAAPGRPILIQLRRCQTKKEKAASVQIDIVDEGPGVPPEMREQVFEPFYTTKFTGRGLGLPMVSGIAKQLSGSVEILDHVDGGSLVRLLIPLSPDASL